MTEQPIASPSPSAYSPEQAARDAAINKTQTSSPPFYLTPSGGFTGIPVQKEANKNLAFGPYIFQFDAALGYITAEDNTTPGSTIQNVSFLADPKNNKNIVVDEVDGKVVTANDMANKWLLENGNTSKVSDLRTLLIARGWLSGADAKYSVQFGTIGDAALAKALSGAISEISWRNVALMKSGSDPLTLENGLQQLTKIAGIDDGTTTRINKQEFRPEDYRQLVNESFIKERGRGASDDELNIFIKTLQGMQDKNPATTTTTTSGDTVTSSTKGGVTTESATDALKKQMIKDPESADYQEATTYMNWFTEALDGGINLND